MDIQYTCTVYLITSYHQYVFPIWKKKLFSNKWCLWLGDSQLSTTQSVPGSINPLMAQAGIHVFALWQLQRIGLVHWGHRVVPGCQSLGQVGGWVGWCSGVGFWSGCRLVGWDCYWRLEQFVERWWWVIWLRSEWMVPSATVMTLLWIVEVNGNYVWVI